MNLDKQPQAGRPVVIGLGEVLWDMLPDGKQFGGAPANFAYHAKALGADAHVVSCVGDDDLGREILDRLDGLQLSHDDVALTDLHPTGTVSVELDADGKPDYIIHEPVAWDVIPWSERLTALAGQTDAVCFGSLAQRSAASRQTICDFLAATPDECLRIFDINLRQHYYSGEIITNSLQTANVLKLNDDELPEIARLLSIPGDETDILSALLKQFNLTLIALTKGDRGSLLLTADGQSSHIGQPVEVADTVGAGDAFTAVIAMNWMQGCELDAINTHANRVASFVCSQNGATPEMPSELQEFS